MRERRTLSPEEMEALLAHAGGVPPDPSSSAGTATPAQPDGALLQEFAHFLLTGALQAQWGAGRVRRLDVEPAPGVPLPGDSAYGGQRAVRLEGDLAGVLVLGVRALPGAGEAPGAGEGAADALALALAADLPARMGRLLGVALAARSAVKPADLEEEPGATPREEWFGFLGRVDGGDHGSWELYIGFSPGLAGAVSALLQGENGTDAVPGPDDWTGSGTGSAGRGSPSPSHSGSPRSRVPGPIRPARFPVLEGREAEGEERADVDLLGDLVLRLTVEVGRATVRLQDLMEWRPGTVVVLDRLAGEMVDVLVNGRPVAKGEILVVEDFFTVKITDIVSPLDRVRGLNRG